MLPAKGSSNGAHARSHLGHVARLHHDLMTVGAPMLAMWETLQMRRRIAFTAILIGSLAVSGCVESFPGDQKLPQDLFKAARQSERAPAGFHDDVRRKSCGQVTLGQGEQVPTDAVDCMDSAIGRLDAELAVVSLTTEGDPIVDFYRTSTGTPGVEVFTDGEFDSYGSKEWVHQDCPKTTTHTSLQGCLEN